MHSTVSTDPAFRRLLVVGGDGANTRLWISGDGDGEVWRKSVELPYGSGGTSFGATLITKDEDTVYLTGGFSDATETSTSTNANKIYSLVPNSYFREVGEDEVRAGGSVGVAVPMARRPGEV